MQTGLPDDLIGEQSIWLPPIYQVVTGSRTSNLHRGFGSPKGILGGEDLRSCPWLVFIRVHGDSLGNVLIQSEAGPTSNTLSAETCSIICSLGDKWRGN